MRLFAVLLFVAPMWSGGALAFECSSVETVDEKALCQNPRVVAVLAELLAQEKILATAPDKEIATAQAIWQRENLNCGGEEECLLRSINTRLRFLRGQPVTSNTVNVTFEPVIKAKEDKDWFLVEGLRFRNADAPYQVEWNNTIDRAIASVFGPDGAVDQLQDSEPGENGEPGSVSFTASQSDVTYISDTLFSATTLFRTHESGEFRSHWLSTSTNVQVETGKALLFDEFFKPGSDLKVIALCEQFVLNGEDTNALNRQEIVATVLDMDYWSISSMGAEITFPDHDEKYTDSCVLKSAELSKLVRPEYGIWQ